MANSSRITHDADGSFVFRPPLEGRFFGISMLLTGLTLAVLTALLVQRLQGSEKKTAGSVWAIGLSMSGVLVLVGLRCGTCWRRVRIGRDKVTSSKGWFIFRHDRSYRHDEFGPLHLTVSQTGQLDKRSGAVTIAGLAAFAVLGAGVVQHTVVNVYTLCLTHVSGKLRLELARDTDADGMTSVAQSLAKQFNLRLA